MKRNFKDWLAGKYRKPEPCHCPNCNPDLWRKFMADISILTSAVRDLIAAVKPLTDRVNGDKATIAALTEEVKVLKDKDAETQAAADALVPEVQTAKDAAVAAGEVGGSMGGSA